MNLHPKGRSLLLLGLVALMAVVGAGCGSSSDDSTAQNDAALTTGSDSDGTAKQAAGKFFKDADEPTKTRGRTNIWESFLSAQQSKPISGKLFSAKISDRIVTSALVVGYGTSVVTGSSSITWSGTTNLPSIEMVDKLFFPGVKVSVSTQGFGVGVTVSGTTNRALTYKTTVRNTRHIGHIYAGVTAKGTQYRTVHEMAARTKVGSTTYDLVAADSCGTYTICY